MANPLLGLTQTHSEGTLVYIAEDKYNGAQLNVTPFGGDESSQRPLGLIKN